MIRNDHEVKLKPWLPLATSSAALFYLAQVPEALDQKNPGIDPGELEKKSRELYR